MCSEIQGDQHLESRVRSEIQASERFFFLRPLFLKRPFQVSPRRIQAHAVATAVGGIGHTPAGIAVLSLLEHFSEFSLLVSVLLFFGSGVLFFVKFVHYAT